MNMKSHEAYKLMFNNYPDVVTIEQLCEMLGGISIKSAYRLLRNGKIKGFIVGRRYRIPKIHVFEYLGIVEKNNT